MKKYIRGMIWASLGLMIAVPGVLSAVHSLHRLSPIPDNLTGIVARVRYFDLRWEILLVALGVICLLASVVHFLSPGRVRVALSRPGMQEDTPSSVEDDRHTQPAAPAVPAVECYLHTRLLGTTFANPDGSSRQSLLAGTTEGDVLVCRTLSQREAVETVGIFTIRGRQLGYLDTSFVRLIREQYPNRRIGVCVEQVKGGQGLPYTCDLRVTVFSQ